VIVAKIVPGAEGEVATTFGRSDLTELPQIAGIRHRSLYSLGDLYVHLIETEDPAGQTLAGVREHPEFKRISEDLRPYISAYLPTWRSPRDAVATCFYAWDDAAEARRRLHGEQA
jgi:cyclase